MNPEDWIDTARDYGLAVEVTYPEGDTALFVERDTWVRVGSEPEGPVSVDAVRNAIVHCAPDVRLREAETALSEVV